MQKTIRMYVFFLTYFFWFFKQLKLPFFEYFSQFFCTEYTGKCGKQAEIQFLCYLNFFFEFSVFLVSVLNYKKFLEVTENSIWVNFLSFNSDTKKQFKQYKNWILACFSHLPVYPVQKNGEKHSKNGIRFIRVINSKF